MDGRTTTMLGTTGMVITQTTRRMVGQTGTIITTNGKKVEIIRRLMHRTKILTTLGIAQTVSEMLSRWMAQAQRNCLRMGKDKLLGKRLRSCVIMGKTKRLESAK